MRPLLICGDEWLPLVRDRFDPVHGWVREQAVGVLVNRCGILLRIP